MSTQSTNDPSRNSAPNEEEPPLRGLAISSSGPAWTLPAQASAENFNRYHDELGRFTTGGEPHQHGGRPAQRRDGKEVAGQAHASQGTIASIRDYAKSSKNLQTCVVAAARSMIATMRASTDDQRPVPNEDDAEKQFATAVGRNIDWSQGVVTRSGDEGAAYAKIVQNVLTQNGISSDAKFNYPSAKALADDIIAKGVPVIANIITAARGATLYEHAVLIQWDKGSQQFLINNINTEGNATPYPPKVFENGELPVNNYRTGTKVTTYVRIDLQNAVIFARKP